MLYRFDDCELDDRLYQLRRKGERVEIEPKTFDLLDCSVAKKHEQGIAEIEQAIALDPNWADAYAQLGLALGYVGRPEEGIEIITKAMRLIAVFT